MQNNPYMHLNSSPMNVNSQPGHYASVPGDLRYPSARREWPRLQMIPPEVQMMWEEILCRCICFFDTCTFMMYTPETVNTVFHYIRDVLLRHPGCYIAACGETRIELERLSRSNEPCARLAECSLAWYNELKRQNLLSELKEFGYTNNEINRYADPSLLIRLMSEMLLRHPQGKPLAFITRDNHLGEDALSLNRLKIMGKCEPVTVFFVNPMAKVVPFVAKSERQRGALVQL